MAVKVAIVAMGPSRNAFISLYARGGPHAIWDEVWTLNGLIGTIKADRYFVMDDLEEKSKDNSLYWQGIIRQAKAHEGPIYTSKLYADCPGMVEYPLEEVLNKTGHHLGNAYLNNSVPYMIALAIAEGATQLGLYGCDYTDKNVVHEAGRSCTEYWCGYARAKGCKVYTPPTSTLLEGDKPVFYGYWTENIVASKENDLWKIERTPK